MSKNDSLIINAANEDINEPDQGLYYSLAKTMYLAKYIYIDKHIRPHFDLIWSFIAQSTMLYCMHMT